MEGWQRREKTVKQQRPFCEDEGQLGQESCSDRRVAEKGEEGQAAEAIL